MELHEWLRKVDDLFEKNLNINIYDLSDWGFAKSFAAGETPEQAFAEFKDKILIDMGFDLIPMISEPE